MRRSPRRQLSTAKRPNVIVEYDGDPKFEKIQGNGFSRAVNTSSTVLLYQNYLLCMRQCRLVRTGPGPDGPWQVATSVPDEITAYPPG